AVQDNHHYSAFGSERNPSNPTNPFRFNGEYLDTERGEYYLRARSYSPRTGRFTQPDPHWNINNMQNSPGARMQASNLYAFGMNNPVMWSDPSGLSAKRFCFMSQQMAIIPGRQETPSSQASSGNGNNNDNWRPPATSENFTARGGGVTLTRDGNDVAISALFYFPEAGTIFNRDRIPWKKWPGEDISHAYAFLYGVRTRWSGMFGDDFNVTVTADYTTSRRGLSRNVVIVDIRYGHGVSNVSNNRAWSNRNRGTVTMYTGDSRTDHSYTLSEFKWVSAHEFGHILGIPDVVGINSIMYAFYMPTEEIDILMALTAAETGRRQRWFSN
ncbi:MAG: matrixin family metalloprotease, partial [Defluviitaleaceae bacterium]|nr:matrixin family metalloprotease [Defluviitaleaceae bacterium]